VKLRQVNSLAEPHISRITRHAFDLDTLWNPSYYLLNHMRQIGKAIIAIGLAVLVMTCTFVAGPGKVTGEITARNGFLPQGAVITPTLQLLIPLYSYPSWAEPDIYLWDEVITASKRIPVTAIINPNSGPGGGPPNSDYQVGLAMLRSACITMVGYVHTDYGNRGLSQVKAEVDLYALYFDIHGIFFDEVADGAAQLPYYRELYSYVKTKPRLNKVILNPGARLDEGYIKEPRAGDSAIIFEDFPDDWPSYTPDPYLNAYPADRFALLIHTTPDSNTMQSQLDLAVARNIGYVYVTDDTLPNPWDSLPSFWPAEVDYIQALNAGAEPSRCYLYLPLILKK
jgi:hypothetical protein